MSINSDGQLFERELHHRTANVLQSALAALHLSKRGADAHLDSAITRLTGAAKLQALLANHGSHPTNLLETVTEVGKAVWRAGGARSDVEIVTVGSRVILQGEAARVVLMIVAELVTNSLKHAFRDFGGTIIVRLIEHADHCEVAVEDTGHCSTWLREGGQGAAIVDNLAEMIGGRITRTRIATGSRVAVAFPVADRWMMAVGNA